MRYLACLLFVIPGCGPATGTVEGAASYAGKPIERGVIIFEPLDGVGPAVEGAIVDGRYRLAGAQAPRVGRKRVRIHGFEKTGRMIEGSMAGVPAGQKIEERRPMTPAKYNDQSQLEFEVVPGANRKDFDLAK